MPTQPEQPQTAAPANDPTRATPPGTMGEMRRRRIVADLRASTEPVAGSELAQRTGVSRQAIARDIAVLRAEGEPIVSTSHGYAVEGAARHRRILKVRHTREQLADELTTVVDLGGCVVDVMVNHRVYGRIRGRLGIKSRRDVQRFLDDIATGKSAPLMEVTSGYHFHTISADDEATLDAIEQALDRLGFLVPLLPYEKDELAAEGWSVRG